MAQSKVIIFGPTGNIGSWAATTAQSHGAKVILAMRDTQKSIPTISSEQEKSGGYERVQADLTNPESVKEAISKSGATGAFFYLQFGTPDHMKATIEAMKYAGIKLAVFLSSFTVPVTGKEDVPQSDIISWAHAQVELSLEAIFPAEQRVAIRPGGFATNTVNFWKHGVQAGEVKLYGPSAKFDYIAHNDMGRVAGSVVAKGKPEGQDHIYLFGPKLWSQEEAVSVIEKALGKDIKMTEIGAEEGKKQLLDAGLPPPLAEYLITSTGKMVEGEGTMSEDGARFDQGQKNIEKYGGKPSMPFDQWAKEFKSFYTS